MKVECNKKKFSYTREVFTIDGVDFEVEDLLGCLSELEDTDGAFTALKIHNKDMENLLLKYKLASPNIRGGWSQHLNSGRIGKFRKKLNAAQTKYRKAELKKERESQG